MSVRLVKEDLAQDKGVPGSRRPTTTKPTTKWDSSVKNPDRPDGLMEVSVAI